MPVVKLCNGSSCRRCMFSFVQEVAQAAPAATTQVHWRHMRPGLSVIKFGCTCQSNDCLPITEVYLSLTTRASYVRSPWMTCQWEGQLMRFCVWFKLFNLQINMEKVGSCQHFCVSVLIIYGNILNFCCSLSYNTRHISWNSTDMFCSLSVGFCESACITEAKNSTLRGKEHNVLLQYWCCTGCPNLMLEGL